MRQTSSFILIAVLAGLLLSGCSGAGGGTGLNDSENTPIDRDRLFAEEALQRVLDRVIVNCERVTCTGDGEHFDSFDGFFGTLFELCQYRCMPSEIDDSGEVRHFLVKLQWGRIESECFPEEAEIALLIQIIQSCEETL